jgi:hypothetical protein
MDALNRLENYFTSSSKCASTETLESIANAWCLEDPRAAVERILNVSGQVDAVSKASGLIVRTLNQEDLEAPSTRRNRAPTSHGGGACSFRGTLSTPISATTIPYHRRLQNSRITLHIKLLGGSDAALRTRARSPIPDTRQTKSTHATNPRLTAQTCPLDRMVLTIHPLGRRPPGQRRPEPSS